MIGILNYGMGNLKSVQKAVEHHGVTTKLIETHSDFDKITKIILPGVGHFGQAMTQLKSRDLINPLHSAICEQTIPVLGICLGMQLMCKSSEEGDAEGLGWIDATVQRVEPQDTLRYKVPHTGWNTLEKQKSSGLLENIASPVEMYFVHSYYVKCNNPSDVLTLTNYTLSFASSFEHKNIFGVQFHPEKSHQSGSVMLKNFLNL